MQLLVLLVAVVMTTVDELVIATPTSAPEGQLDVTQDIAGHDGREALIQ